MRENMLSVRVLKEAAAGCAFALLLTLAAFVGTAGALTFLGFSEAYIMPVLFAGTLLSVFIGAMVSCPYTTARGPIHGLLVGILYCLFMLAVGAVTVRGFYLYGNLALRLFGALGAGILGGMTGRLRPARC